MKDVKIGDKILIIEMKDEPQYSGRAGSVLYVDDAGQIHGTWGGCALIPGIDKYVVIKEACDEENNS